jgi:hypothetical protein
MTDGRDARPGDEGGESGVSDAGAAVDASSADGDGAGSDGGGEDTELYEQAMALLGPGEDTLVGVVIHTDFPKQLEQPMNKLMRDAGDRIAGHLTDEEVYVYAGEDDERFGTGQFHGRRLSDDEVVWECQQLLRDGSFDVVFYWEAQGVHDAILADLEGMGTGVVPVTEDGYGAV